MKNILPLVIILSIGVGFSRSQNLITPLNPVNESEFELQTAASFEYKVPEVGNTKIKLSKIPNWGDPGDFMKIEISNSQYSKSYSNGDGWVRFNDNYPVNEELKEMNKIETDLLLLASNSKTSLLVLFGWSYANDHGLCTVIDLRTGKIIYNQNSELRSISLEKGTLTFSDKSTIKCYGQLN